MTILFGLSRWALNAIMTLEREEKGNNTNNTDTYRKGWYEGRGKRKWPQTKKCWQPETGRGKRQILPCSLNRHAALLKNLESGSKLVSRTGRTNSISLTTQFVVVCLGSHRRLSHNSHYLNQIAIKTKNSLELTFQFFKMPLSTYQISVMWHCLKAYTWPCGSQVSHLNTAPQGGKYCVFFPWHI